MKSGLRIQFKQPWFITARWFKLNSHLNSDMNGELETKPTDVIKTHACSSGIYNL